MDAHTKYQLAQPLTAAEKYIRTFTSGDTTVKVMYTGNTGWLNVSVRIAGVLRYSESWSSEDRAMADFAERAARVDLARMMAASEKATRELETISTPVERGGAQDLAGLAEEMMEHEGIDRTYILEALISDLRGGDPRQGLKALREDRLGR